jgi:hypothetical protein
MRVRSTLLALAVVLALMLSTLLAATASAGGRPFHLTLTGAAERPVPPGGDPDGTGTATLWFNPGRGEVCYDYSVSGVALPLGAAHVHVGSVDVAGPVVIPLPPTRPDGGTGCVSADRSLILAIFQDPAAYYFNVHNAEFPGGALRAQLG